MDSKAQNEVKQILYGLAKKQMSATLRTQNAEIRAYPEETKVDIRSFYEKRTITQCIFWWRRRRTKASDTDILG